VESLTANRSLSRLSHRDLPIDPSNKSQFNGSLHSPKSPASRGIIWGKQEAYLRTPFAKSIITPVAALCPLISTLTPRNRHDGITYVGHQSPPAFRALLAESKFLLGVGDPLSGPSALEAMLVGTTFLNPSFSPAVLEAFKIRTRAALKRGNGLGHNEVNPKFTCYKSINTDANAPARKSCATTTRLSIRTCSTALGPRMSAHSRCCQ